ncbi:uncharacterized protein METZ01_LOCUS10865 [marine metagenome]|uniref:Uncharacterized protein n=1 Tax=marine metagenome TaxID=408172 RepID=A0A381NTQ9_9ZZZZ
MAVERELKGTPTISKYLGRGSGTYPPAAVLTLCPAPLRKLASTGLGTCRVYDP